VRALIERKQITPHKAKEKQHATRHNTSSYMTQTALQLVALRLQKQKVMH
jgi:hypothetical protein